jgi:hypothetical protein
MFAQSGKAVVGLYVGSQIEKASAATIAQDSFATPAKADKVPSRFGAQICGDQPYSAQTFGIYADVSGNISAVQDVVRDWSTGKWYVQIPGAYSPFGLSGESLCSRDSSFAPEGHPIHPSRLESTCMTDIVG